MPPAGICLHTVTVDLVGWVSSLVLLATILGQLRKQWRARSSEGVSRWLFVGQTAASAGFTLYSALVGNWIFTVTNALLLLSAITGCVLTWRFRSQGRRLGPLRA
jgi:MtN3 and saliva related transmembrane protein